MKQLTFLMSLLSTVFFFSFANANNAELELRDGPFVVETVTKVNKSSSVVQQFMRDRVGSSIPNLQYDKAEVATYQNTDIKALIIPQLSRPNYSKSAVAFFVDNRGFRIILMETTINRPGSGTLNFYHTDNTQIASLSVSGSQIHKFDIKDNSRHPRWSGDVYWDCVKSCKGDESTKGPTWLQIGCDFAVVEEACKAGQYAHCLKKCW